MRLDEEPGHDGLRRMHPSLRVRRQAVNLKQRIGEVLRRVLDHEGPLSFSSLIYRSGRRLPRMEVLVTFLAVLELVREGRVSAWQRGILGEIILARGAESGEAEGLPQPVSN